MAGNLKQCARDLGMDDACTLRFAAVCSQFLRKIGYRNTISQRE